MDGSSGGATGRAINTQMRAGEWAMLLGLSGLWGGSFFLIEKALTGFAPLTLVSVRVGIAATALWLMILARGERFPNSARLWGAFAVMGLINNVIPFALIVWGQTAIESALASILNATAPVFTVIAASILLPDERATRLKFLGVGLGVAGVAVMIGPTALMGLGGAVLAQFAVLGGALSYALAGVYGRRFGAMAVSPWVVAAGQLTMSTLLIAPLAIMVEAPFARPAPGAEAWLSVSILALSSTALAYVLYFRLLSTAGATNLLLVTFLNPVSAIGLGVTFLGESLNVFQIAGMALIGLGLVAIDGRVFRRGGASGGSPLTKMGK